jgi:gas vesicle protein
MNRIFSPPHFSMKLLKFIFAITIGGVYGMLFAQRPGKELRDDLKKSKQPMKTFLQEGIAVDTEAFNVIKTELQNSDEVQKMLTTMQAHVKSLGDQAQNFSKDGLQQAQKEMETLAYSAKKIADELKVKFEAAKREATEEIKNTAQNMQNNTDDRM